MRNIYNRLRSFKRRNIGFTLIELIVVASIIAVLATIGSFSVLRSLEHSRERVCMDNCRQVEQLLQAEVLLKDDIDESEGLLSQFILDNGYTEICPSGGVISVLNGELRCSIHSPSDDDDEDGGAVPYLFIY